MINKPLRHKITAMWGIVSYVLDNYIDKIRDMSQNVYILPTEIPCCYLEL